MSSTGRSHQDPLELWHSSAGRWRTVDPKPVRCGRTKVCPQGQFAIVFCHVILVDWYDTPTRTPLTFLLLRPPDILRNLMRLGSFQDSLTVSYLWFFDSTFRRMSSAWFSGVCFACYYYCMPRAILLSINLLPPLADRFCTENEPILVQDPFEILIMSRWCVTWISRCCWLVQTPPATTTTKCILDGPTFPTGC